LKGISAEDSGGLKVFLELFRPFTLLPPATGIFCGALCAIGAWSRTDADLAALEILQRRWFLILVAATAASILNAASNVLNQYTDKDIDSINKPSRPLPSGRVTERSILILTGVLFSVGLLTAWALSLCGLGDFFVLALLGTVSTVLYSVKPFRLKRFLYFSNLAIAVPRGYLLIVAGWSCATSVSVFEQREPWYLGMVLFLFLLGAASTKDFSDMRGDQLGGCVTLPIKFGARKAAWMIAPFLTLPWLLLPYDVLRRMNHHHIGVLSADRVLLLLLGLGLAGYGAYVSHLIVRAPEQLARSENHPSWKHMYLMMMVAQTGFAAAYLVG